jgi:hypothetical protein
VPSFEGDHGEVYIFKTPHHPDFKTDWRETMVKVALATSAAPTYYRPFRDAGYIFVDGGVWAIPLNGQHYPTLDAAQKAGAPTVNIGVFINALINFVIIAFVVFWVGKAAARLMRREAEAPSAPPAPTRSEVLLEEIPGPAEGARLSASPHVSLFANR